MAQAPAQPPATDHAAGDAARDLAGRAARGDRDAWEALYRAYGPVIHGILLARRLSPADADDLTQEVFLKAIRAISTLHDAERFGPWLCAIARNMALAHRRTLWRRAGLLLGWARARPEAESPRPDHDGPSAQRALEAIASLPEAYRETLMLRLVEQLSGPEIAERTGLTEGSVRVNLSRGMKLLRAALAADQSDPDRPASTTPASA